MARAAIFRLVPGTDWEQMVLAPLSLSLSFITGPEILVGGVQSQGRLATVKVIDHGNAARLRLRHSGALLTC